jgi:predicted phage terminase large subunit-like protein
MHYIGQYNSYIIPYAECRTSHLGSLSSKILSMRQDVAPLLVNYGPTHPKHRGPCANQKWKNKQTPHTPFCGQAVQSYLYTLKQDLKRIVKPRANGRLNKVENIMQRVSDLQSRAVERTYLIIDDPHSEQDALNMSSMEKAYEWYTSGPRQRLQPGGAIVLIMTRWNMKDLTGMLLKSQKELKSDQWELIEFPAILPSGEPVWPEYWKLDELEGVKASLSIGKWNAQWMQNPTAEEGAIIKREWWKIWEKDYIPPLDHIIQSYDTAFLKKESADYSAITTWGVFYPNEDSAANLILLDSFKDRLEFPELKKVAMEQYNYWKPETVIIESKASGLPLTYELRKMGIPVINFTPSRGNDKHARVNAVAPLFESGVIWAPDDKFAEEVIEECASFPYGDHDDLVDSTTQAIMRFRQGGFVAHPEDLKEDSMPRIERTYY